jgi:hypothetical protein
MRKVVFMAMAISLSLSLSAFCENEITTPRSFSLGFGLGQRAGDLSASLNITSPYMHFKLHPNDKNGFAIRVSGDFRTKNEVPIGGTADSLMSYCAARIGIIRGIDVSNLIRMYTEVGGVSVFPTAELASSKIPCFGVYGYLGSEVFIGRNLITKNTSIFMEIGYESGFSEHRFDKLANRPYMEFGPTACAGGRFYF